MTKKKHGRQHKPHGHFCKICGEYKANEKFSGKGHAAHICKPCAALPAAERSVRQTIRKIENMAFRYLNKSEIQWLRGKMNDSRLEVSAVAQEVHQMKFPHYALNQAKKELKAFALELYLHDTVWTGYGDDLDVHAFVSLDDAGAFRFVDYNAPEAEREVQLSLDPAEARRCLRYAVHELDAPFWYEDCDDTDLSEDPFPDLLPEYRPDFPDTEGTDGDEGPSDKGKEPLCTLHLSLNTGADKTLAFYHQTPEQAVELFWMLMAYLDDDDEDEEIMITIMT